MTNQMLKKVVRIVSQALVNVDEVGLTEGHLAISYYNQYSILDAFIIPVPDSNSEEAAGIFCKEILRKIFNNTASIYYEQVQ